MNNSVNYIETVKNKKEEVQDEKILELRRKVQYLENKLKLKRIALNSSNNSTLITDETGKILWVNNAFSEITGYSFEEAIGNSPRIMKSGKHSDKFYENLWNTILSGQIWKGEITNRKKDGSLYQEKLMISPVLDDNGRITNFIATKQDLTNQKEIDQALNESYIKYEELAYIFNQGPAVGFLWSVDDTRTIEFVTDNIKQWDYTPRDFYTHKFKFEDIIYDEDRDWIIRELDNKIKFGEESFKQHYRIVTKNKKVRWIDSYLQVRLGESNRVTHLQGVVLDVTERKEAEEESKYQLEQLMQADKMIALGTLVSGVVHEINNPNNFVILNIPLIEKVWFSLLPIMDDYYNTNGDFNVGGKLKYSKIKESMPLLLGGINEGANRIKNIVEDLKSFARKDTAGYDQNVDLNQVIQTSVNLTANLVSKSTENFTVKYTNQPIIVKGNKQKLEQVVINLIENSCQALEKREQSIRIEIINNCKNAIINVSDKGIGMEKLVLRKITDPFFTTKRNNGGTGLGLSISSKIIMQHNGTLEFNSEPGSGTKAIIKIPIWSGK